MPDLYQHSIAVIKANQSHNGAYIASPTFPRYRYSWFRDGTYIAYAMDLVGEHESAERFYQWAVRMITDRELAIERTITGAQLGQVNPNDLLDTRYTLDGEVGTEEWPNFQLDGFGTLLWGIADHVRQMGGLLPQDWHVGVALLARYLRALWRMPCYDCWEEFSDKIHISTLAALYGGLCAAAELLHDSSYAETADEIKQYVLSNGVHNGTLCKFVGNDAVDANLLHVATPYRLLEPDDPRMAATATRIENELRRNGGGVHRYADDSYYGGGEWLLLTAYLGWYYLEHGEIERAQALARWIEGATSGEGEMPEQIAANLNHPHMLAEWEDLCGPSASPLLWSHAAYLTLVTHIQHAVPEQLPAAVR